MKELDFINIIEKTLSKKSHIGDDCAYLKELGIVITHDSLVQDIHFSLEYSTPEDIAFKSIMVNISDIYASGAIPKYITIALSLPKETKTEFIKDFYKTVNCLATKIDFEVVGGDLTGSDKIMISICAIGITQGQNISSRANAKLGDYIITSGVHGSSSAGLWLLQNKIGGFEELKQSHLRPIAQGDFAKDISSKIKRYSMMDSSDGLADALFKIAKASKVSLSIDTTKIPYNKDIKEVAQMAKKEYLDWILFGGEDFQLVATVSKEDFKKLKKNWAVIGEVKALKGNNPIELKSENIFIKNLKNLDDTFNHFKE